MESGKIRITGDGSHTLVDNKTGETYHSVHGAIQESEHVFIRAGLDYFKESKIGINVFEVGFGTGLNALMTYVWAGKNKVRTNYQSIELYPVPFDIVKQLNYSKLLNVDEKIFHEMHKTGQEEKMFSEYFSLQIFNGSLQNIRLPAGAFDVVFFDAFSPGTQPEMWTEDVFGKISAAMRKDGILTTYSTKGDVKRALKANGFTIEKLPGPPGKREILRAVLTD